MFMVILVLHDPHLLHDILEAWEQTGISGITILLSTGYKRLQVQDVLREDMPLIPSLEDLMQREESFNRTLFTVVDDDEAVNRIVKATQNVVGDFSLPNTGILTVLPVAQVYGLDKINTKN